MTKPKIDGTRKKLGSYKFWIRYFKPIPNPLLIPEEGSVEFDDWCYLFENTNHDKEEADLFLRLWEGDVHNIWTLTDDGGLFIQPGFHAVGRIGYFITEKPWVNEYDQYKW